MDGQIFRSVAFDRHGMQAKINSQSDMHASFVLD
jgi:hypothetical protein